MLYCPNKTNLFGERCGTVPIKPKKTIFLSLPGLPANKIVFIGTVQHFLPLGLKKCCTVTIKPIFLVKSAVLSQ